MNYKNYRMLFKSVKRNAKEDFYSKQLIQFKGDAKKTWRIMKEVIVKAQKTQPLFSCKIIVNYIKIIKGKWRANEFNNLSINIDPELSKVILRHTRSFKNYVPNFNTTMPTGPTRVHELNNALFSRKTNKCPRYDEINVSVIRS